MQRGQEISREELCIGTSAMSNQRRRKRSSEEIYYTTSEELEMFAVLAGQVLRKRSRKEEAGSSAEQTGQAPRKRSRKEEVESSTEQTGQATRKRSRKEEVGSSAEQTGQATRKRSREEEAGSSAEQKGQAPRKRSREEEEGSSAEQTGHAPRKRSREEEEGSSAEQTGHAPRKRSRYYTDSEDLQSCAERKGEKRRWSQDTDRESHLRKKRRSDGGADDGTTERVEAPTEHVAAPRGHKETNLTPESFIFHKKLGSGAFGMVVLATHIDSDMLVAVKIVQKSQVASYSNDLALCERLALEKVGSSHYCIHAYATFQTENHFFYVMEYLSGGDLMGKAGRCDITTLRLTAAEIVCGLQFIHSTGVIHRDLKLENILIDGTGHIKIVDFGIASISTPERKMPCDPSMDYYMLGITLCDLAFGTFSIHIPRVNAAYTDFKDLLKELQCTDKELRKAAFRNIRDHKFFEGINWGEVEARETRPPFFVRRKGLRKVTRQKIPLEDLLDDENIPAKEQLLLDGFSFESDQWRAIQKLN